MGEVVGVHRDFYYEASYREQGEHIVWCATLSRDRELFLGEGMVALGEAMFPDTATRVHLSVQRYIDAVIPESALGAQSARRVVG